MNLNTVWTAGRIRHMNECTICGHSEQFHYVPDDSPYPKLACIWGDSEGPCLCSGFKL